jgi:nitroimidazol reductase NimA-like FMN-containing flavoprotein (pyridoxamine 5'-phosphate oxidase superfamily)
MSRPTSEPIAFPEVYGKATGALDWSDVENRLEKAERYWLATTRRDGRPHVIPIDGVWLEGAWYFGGAPETVHQRSVQENPNIVMHLEDPMAAVIVEGVAERVELPAEKAKQLASATTSKYGYPTRPEDYSGGVWRLEPRRVLAWNSFPKEPTRFRFD